MSFSAAEIETYSRQLMLPEIGGQGQQKLSQADILVIGAGGLGSPIALYLAAAGVGKLWVMDGDVVERSNLNRQVLFRDTDIGSPKATTTANSLYGLRSSEPVRPIDHNVSKKNCHQVVAHRDLIIDCTDNYKTRKLINRACVDAGVPLMSVAVAAWTAQIALYGQQSCYECWAQEPKERDPCGIVGAMAGIAGTMAAAEAIKFIVGAMTPSLDHLLIMNGLTMETTRIGLPKTPNCYCSNRSLARTA